MNAPENSLPKGGGAIRGIGEARNLRAIFANRAMIVTTPARRVVESLSHASLFVRHATPP